MRNIVRRACGHLIQADIQHGWFIKVPSNGIMRSRHHLCQLIYPQLSAVLIWCSGDVDQGADIKPVPIGILIPDYEMGGAGACAGAVEALCTCKAAF